MDVGGLLARLVHLVDTCKRCSPGHPTVRAMLQTAPGKGSVVEIRDRCEGCERFLRTYFFCVEQKYVVVSGERKKPVDFKTKAAGGE